MTIHLTEEELALYAGGDLHPSRLSLLARHVAECVDCRDAVADRVSSRVWLAQFRAEPLEEDLQQMRGRVFDRINAPPPIRRPWAWVAVPALCSAVALFCWPTVHRSLNATKADTTKQASGTVRVADRILMPTPIARAYPWRLAVRHSPTAGLRTVKMTSAGNGPPVIRMTTADPAVVILLQTEERTDSNENE